MTRALCAGGVVLAAWACGGATASSTDAGADKWFRIAAIDAAGRRAWTNPIWIDELI